MPEYSTLDNPRFCTYADCGRKHYANGLCHGHYQQLQRGVVLRPLAEPRRTGPVKQAQPCAFDPCGKPARTGGLCSGHRNQRDKGRELTPLRTRKTNGSTVICGFGDCGNDTAGGAHGLCRGHYRQKRLGRDLEPLPDWNDNTARDDTGRKRCAGCRDWKSAGSFHKDAHRPDGLQARCRACIRSEMLVRTYGISVAQYEVMLSRQGGGCAICGVGESSDGSFLAVDHDHACCPDTKSCGGCVRGLLCRSCNQGLGCFRDDIERMRNAIEYLS